MSKNQKGTKDKRLDLPVLPPKYINERKIEECEKKMLEDRHRIDKIINENKILQSEIKSKELETAKSIIAYNTKLDELQSELRRFEKQNNQYKADIETIQAETAQLYSSKITQIKEENDKKMNVVLGELAAEKEKSEEYRNKKNEYKQELEDLKKERDRLNETLISTINKYEDCIKKIKIDSEKEISIFKQREEEYIKQRETLSENEVYEVYKELKLTFEKNLTELKEYKDSNSRISDENRIYKLSIETSDSILKECAKIQLQKQKLINQYKEIIDSKSSQLTTMKDSYETQLTELNEQFNSILSDLNKEVVQFKNKCSKLTDENKKLKQLSQMILDQRNEVEMFFLESLEEVKMEIYKKKKQEQKKRSLFPSLVKKYEKTLDEVGKVTISDLSPEDKEKMLKLLFCKINENAKTKNYTDFGYVKVENERERMAMGMSEMNEDLNKNNRSTINEIDES